MQMSSQTVKQAADDAAEILRDLADIKMMTTAMRSHQEAITRLGVKRGRIVVDLRERDNPVPYRMIAEAIDVSEQAVYQILRKHHRQA